MDDLCALRFDLRCVSREFLFTRRHRRAVLASHHDPDLVVRGGRLTAPKAGKPLSPSECLPDGGSKCRVVTDEWIDLASKCRVTSSVSVLLPESY